MGALSAASDRVQLWSPVLVKELRTRMRGARPAWLQAAYVFIMLVVMGITYAATREFSGPGPWQAGYRYGSALFQALFVAQAVLVALIVPGLTAAAISSEQEQKSYEMLVATRLRARQVVLGKLLSAWLFALLLLTTSLPLAALCLMLGGVSPGEIIWSYGLIALTALFLAAAGLWCSSLVSRSLVAVIGSYGIMGAFMIGSGIAISITSFTMAFGRGPGPSVFGAVNPIGAVYFASDPVLIFGVGVPAGAPAAVMLALTAALATAAASQRLPLLGKRRGTAVRSLAVATVSVGMFLAVGNFGEILRSNHTARDLRLAVIIGSAAVISLTMVLVPLFAAGDLNEPPRGRFRAWLLGGLSPRRLLQPELRSAFPFLALTAVIGYGILAAGFSAFAPATVASWLDWLGMMVGLALVTAFGLSMIGLALSLAMAGWRARALVAVGLVLVGVIPVAALAGVPNLGTWEPPMIVLLNPPAAVITAAYVGNGKWQPVYDSVFAVISITAAIYLVAGVIALFAAKAAFARQARPAEAGNDG